MLVSDRKLKIALVGSRGVPGSYGGFETFYEQLGRRLARRGHSVTVYNRSHVVKDVRREYMGMRIVTLPSIPTKHLDTIVHTFVSTCHAFLERYDIVYYCIVGNSPLAFLPRLTGARTLLNVDGEDWAREKWKGFAKWYQRQCERVATITPNVVIADARRIRQRYRDTFGIEPVFVPYGANLLRNEGDDVLRKWGLERREYLLFVGRLVPENAVLELIECFRGVRTDKKLVILGDAPYVDDYKEKIREAAGDSVVLTGYAFGRDYAQLSSHAYAYVQPSGVEGTRPSVLDQLGFGNCVLVRDTSVNLEVIEDCGFSFDRNDVRGSLTAKLQDLVDDPDGVAAMRERAGGRIRDYYNWEWITDFYEEVFHALIRGATPPQYDSYVSRSRAAGSLQA